MKKGVLAEKSFSFAVRIVKLSQWLQTERKEFVLTKQVLRSGTAVGALISEALFAQSKPDFISKLSISLKEANETNYWIELLYATNFIDIKQHESLIADNKEIIALLVSSIKTAKGRVESGK